MPATPVAGQPLALGIDYAGPAETVLDVTWTTELPFEERALKQLMDRGIVGVPDPSHPLGFEIADVCRDLAQALVPVIARLCAESGTITFAQAFREANYRDLIQHAEVTVRDFTFEVRPLTHKAKSRPRGSSFLDASSLATVLGRDTRPSDYYLVQADAYDARFDQYGMVVSLTTALEVAAYGLLGRLWTQTGRDAPDFSPRLYLGSGYLDLSGRRPFKESEPSTYVRVHELWGARNELVHNGRLAVRTYDPSTEKTDKSQLRDMVDEDLTTFRSAVRSAIRWMAAEP
jgi:hypothetical protein